ncbi:hypothetical protein BOO88_14010 [Stutzerimonas stutzeri]|nr:hypothetical protein BOO89_04880 [Stutzerimonas stutzeri]AZO89988.1 hypothetical protein BOO88_14010 [Stutzerimonas stutzeri]
MCAECLARCYFLWHGKPSCRRFVLQHFPDCDFQIGLNAYFCTIAVDLRVACFDEEFTEFFRWNIA